MFPLTYINHDVVIEGFHNIYYFEFDKYHYHAPESHEFWEMVYVDRGRIVANSSGSICILEAGQAIFHRPGEMHSHISDKEVANNLLVVSFSCRSECMELFGGKVFDLGKTSRTLLSLFIREAKNALGSIPNDYNFRGALDFSEALFGSPQLMESHFAEFLIRLLRAENAGLPEAKARTGLTEKSGVVDMITGYLKENVYACISLNDICNRFFLRKSQLSVIFKEHTGKSPMQYFRYMKIEEAKKLLREDNLSVSEITDMLGFSGIHNFSRTFKNETGFSPTGYKKSVLLLQNNE